MKATNITRPLVIIAVGLGLLAGAATTALADSGTTTVRDTGASATVAERPAQIVELDARLTPAQLDQLRAASAAQTRDMSAAVTSADVGIMAQGGFDRDHWWFKISTADIISIGVGVACRAAFPGVGWFVCPPISAAVNLALQQNPNVGGFWAELYTDGRVRVGTW